MDKQQYQDVEISRIQVPDIRVTSQFDGDLLEELEESIARQGILQPLQLEEVDGVLWLVDGYHRLMAAKELGNPTVPCVISSGTPDSVLLKNLVVNRQRGKSNPAEEAKLIRLLREEGGYSLEKIAQMSGLSIGWTRKLHDIAYLPIEVLTMISQGRLGISHAIELIPLKDTAHQIELAGQAVEWRYTIEQTRLRVIFLLQPALAPSPGGVQFDPRGRPTPVPIPCAGCGEDLTDFVSYLYMCGDCQRLYYAFLGEVRRQEMAATQPAGAGTPLESFPRPGVSTGGP